MIRKVTGPQVAREASQAAPKSAHSVGPDAKALEKSPFAKLKLMHPLLRSIFEMRWRLPTEVQLLSIPLAIAGHSIVASAQTGTGKTAAYGLPLLQRLHTIKSIEAARKIERPGATPLAVILCPTRELAEQVEWNIYQYGKYIPNLRIVGVQGAMKDINAQVRELEKGVDVLVATPGRLITLLRGRVTDATDDLAKPGPTIKSKAQKRANKDLSNKEDTDIFDEDEEEEEELEETFPDPKTDAQDGPEVDEVDEDQIDDEEEDIDDEDEEGEDDGSPLDLEAALAAFGDDPTPTPEGKPAPPKKTPKSELPPLPQSREMLKGKLIDLSGVKFFVLDEVDRMLSLGLFPDVRDIWRYMPRGAKGKSKLERTQVYMVTATLLPRVQELMRRFAPRHQKFDLNKSMEAPKTVKQFVYQVSNRRKFGLLKYLLKRKGKLRGQSCLVFCRTKRRAQRVAGGLQDCKIAAEALHRDQSLAKRRALVESFRNNQFRVLVSTNLMARGIDIIDLPLVVNFDLPHNPEDYLHRIGRTGRAGESGTAISFVGKYPYLLEIGKRVVELDENALLAQIQKFLDDKSLRPTKVPGPWQDTSKPGSAYENEEDNEEKHAKSYASRAKVAKAGDASDPELQGVVIRNRKDLLEKKEEMVQKLLKKAELLAQKKNKTKSDLRELQILQAKNPKLRDFKEGRYEDTIEAFDAKRARRRGVAVPKNLDFLIEKRKKEEAKKLEKRKPRWTGPKAKSPKAK